MRPARPQHKVKSLEQSLRGSNKRKELRRVIISESREVCYRSRCLPLRLLRIVLHNNNERCVSVCQRGWDLCGNELFISLPYIHQLSKQIRRVPRGGKMGGRPRDGKQQSSLIRFRFIATEISEYLSCVLRALRWWKIVLQIRIWCERAPTSARRKRRSIVNVFDKVFAWQSF